MNSAYKKMVQRERRSRLLAQIVGWSTLVLGVVVFHGIWFGIMVYRASIL